MSDEFGRDTVSGVDAITEIGEYLRQGGGKRIRPALLLLAAKLFQYRGPRRSRPRRGGGDHSHRDAGARRHHRRSQTRRGRPSANTQMGEPQVRACRRLALHAGFRIAVQERNFRILDTLIELTQQMVEGELLQMEKLGQTDFPGRAFRPDLPQDCLPVFRLHAHGRNPRRGDGGAGIGALARYGPKLGMAFQIVDDVLDLTASERCREARG